MTHVHLQDRTGRGRDRHRYIDLIGERQFTFLGLNWNHYTIFYTLVMLMFVAALLIARKLHEPKAANFEILITEILIESPQRFWLRIWSRD